MTDIELQKRETQEWLTKAGLDVPLDEIRERSFLLLYWEEGDTLKKSRRSRIVCGIESVEMARGVGLELTLNIKTVAGLPFTRVHYEPEAGDYQGWRLALVGGPDDHYLPGRVLILPL